VLVPANYNKLPKVLRLFTQYSLGCVLGPLLLPRVCSWFLGPLRARAGGVDMCWPLVAEEPHRPTILNLEHCPLKANVSCLIFPLHEGKVSSTQPLGGLDSPSQGSRGQLTSTPPYHSPPSLFPFTIGKVTRAHPTLALFSPYLP
jgi:hypothetical protein